MLKTYAMCKTHKKFGKKVVTKRKSEIKTISDSLKKIADDEILRVQDLWKDHVDFFNADEEGDLTPAPVPVPVTFFEPRDKM